MLPAALGTDPVRGSASLGHIFSLVGRLDGLSVTILRFAFGMFEDFGFALTFRAHPNISRLYPTDNSVSPKLFIASTVGFVRGQGVSFRRGCLSLLVLGSWVRPAAVWSLLYTRLRYLTVEKFRIVVETHRNRPIIVRNLFVPVCEYRVGYLGLGLAQL